MGIDIKQLFSLKGKTVVLIGGHGYLGQVYTQALADAGATLYSCDLGVENHQEGGVYYRKVDAADKAQLQALKAEIVGHTGRVDVLVNCTTAKGDDFYLPFEEVSLEGWEIGMKGNMTVPFLTAQCFVPLMKSQQSGSIINISSIYGMVGNDQRIYEGSNLHEIYVDKSPDIKRIYSHGVYNAAKAGLINFSRYLAAYYGADNVRANAITLGGLEYPQENDTFLKNYGAKVPLGRKGKREEMVGALIYLASDASAYVTGHNLVVDGGFTCW